MPHAAPRPIFNPPPPRRVPPDLIDLGGPPPIIEPDILYENPIVAGPPRGMPEVLGSGGPPPVAIPSVPEAYIPTQEDYRIVERPQVEGAPGPGGLRRALAKILPAARDLTLATAAGANEPTFIGGLGAGIAQHEGQRASVAAQREAQRRAEMKEVADWQKMQLDAAKANAEIAERTARTKKTGEETKLLGPKQKSEAELQAAQATQAKNRARLDEIKAGMDAEFAKLYPQIKKAELDEKVALASKRQFESELAQQKVLAGYGVAEAEALAAQEYADTARGRLAEKQLEYLPQRMKIDQLKADAQFNNSMAALDNAKTRARGGQLTPQVVSTARNAYITAYARIMSQVFDEDLQKAALEELRKTHGWAMQVDPAQLGRQVPATPAGQPAAGGGGATPKSLDEWKKSNPGK